MVLLEKLVVYACLVDTPHFRRVRCLDLRFKRVIEQQTVLKLHGKFCDAVEFGRLLVLHTQSTQTDSTTQTTTVDHAFVFVRDRIGKFLSRLPIYRPTGKREGDYKRLTVIPCDER